MNKEEYIESLISKYSTLKQFKDKSKEELLEIAEKKWEKYKTQREMEEIENLPHDKELKKIYLNLYSKYRKKHDFTSLSDIYLLKDLCWFESYKIYMQNKIINSSKKDSNRDLSNIQKILDSLTKTIFELKDKLGLFSKRNKSLTDIWLSLKHKFQKYIEANRGAFVFQCPSCKKMVLLTRRVKDYEAQEWNMFKGTVLYNEPLMRKIEEKKLTVEEAAEILGVDPEYINKIYQEIYLREKTTPPSS